MNSFLHQTCPPKAAQLGHQVPQELEDEDGVHGAGPGGCTEGDFGSIFFGFNPKVYRVEQKNLAKFSDTCSVRAHGLCIGSPRLVGGRKAGNSNM